MTKRMILRALDGSNPLAFLAALGTLRLLQSYKTDTRVRMRWVREQAWHPELSGLSQSEEELCEMLLAAKTVPIESFAMLGKDITVPRSVFREFVEAAFSRITEKGDHVLAEFAAAFGSEVCEEKRKERIERTDLCFITGSGKQHFLETMEGLAKNVTAGHIYDALFGHWRKGKSLSMRWDPGDAAEYAFRWGEPGKDGAWAVWGANWLAIEALPLFPTQPTRHGLRTTGFREGGRGEWPHFSWPIWIEAASLDTVRSLLSLTELSQAEQEKEHTLLRARGIEEVYRAPRVRIGQGANFKVSFRLARVV